jgi:triacylglycerol lipase
MEEEERLQRKIGVGGEIKKMKINEHEVNYFIAGEGPTILLIHGANIGWGQWHETIPSLVEQHRVIAVDLPGAGGSTKVDFLSLNFEKDVVGLLEEFIERIQIKDFFIVGHSLGAWIVLRLLARGKAKIKKVVLVSPMGFIDYLPFQYSLISITFIAKILSKTVMRPTRVNMKKFLESVLYKAVALKDEFVDYFYASVLREKISHPFLLITSMSRPFRVKEQFCHELSLINFFVPTLIVVGEKDPLIPVSKIFKNIEKNPLVEFRVLPETGHAPFLEVPSLFNELLVNFF